MPRKARERSSTGVYHVMSRGLNKLPIFNQAREKTRIVNLIRENISKYEVAIYAYCIMPNHFHLLIKAELEELSSFMAKILAAFAQYYNYKHNRIGYVFQDRFKSEKVEDDTYFWNCVRYIHRNPAKDGEIEALLKYKHSSFAEIYYEKKDLINEQIYEIEKGRFPTKQQFLKFHMTNNRDIFIDIEEDRLVQYIKIATDILEELQCKHNLDAEEVLEYGETRKEFEQILINTTQISRKNFKIVYHAVRNEIKGTG